MDGFPMGTKPWKEKMKLIWYKLGSLSMFMVDCVGKGGGLALLWGDDILVDIQNYSQRHVNGVITTPISDVQWKFMGFYGHLEVAKRQEAWDLLKELGQLSPTPWLCIGDFNEVLYMSKKWGGCGQPTSQMRNFKLDFGGM
jgi:hypothetical protein